MHKYKIGQKVRIRPNLRANTRIDDVFINHVMPQFSGKICTVQSCYIWHTIPVYYLKEIGWMWAERMLCDVLSGNFISLNDYV